MIKRLNDEEIERLYDKEIVWWGDYMMEGDYDEKNKL